MTIDEIIEYVRNTPGNTNPNVLKTLLQDVSSGGGSSDFSIANVTIENKTSDPLGCILPLIEKGMFFESTYTVLEANESITIQLPLYKNNISLDGPVVFMQDSALSFSVSGAINEDMGTIIISGDGTIEVTTSEVG